MHLARADAITNLPLRSSMRAIVGVIPAMLLLYASTWYSYLLFHTASEMFSIVVAVSIFTIAWNSHQLEEGTLRLLGISCLFVGALDLLHTLSYRGMGIFQEYGTDLPTQLWIAARYLQALSLLASLFFVKRKLDARIAFAVLTLVCGAILLSIFMFRNFPVCFVEGSGLTPFKIWSEYIISSIMLLVVFRLIWKRIHFDPRVLELLISSTILIVLSEVAFTSYLGVYDQANMLGHLLKFISFYLLYKAIVETGLLKPFDLLFRSLKQSEQALRTSHDQLEDRVRERTAELLNSNAALSSEIEARVQTEAALRSSEQKFRMLVETMNEGILLQDVNNRITFANQNICGMLGYTAGTLVGKNISEVLEFGSPDTSAGKPDGNTHRELLIHDSGGNPVPVIISSSNLQAGPAALGGTIHAITDVTILKEAETELRNYAAKLERSNRDLQDFAFVASHDLQEPLRKIMILGSRLRESCADILEGEAAVFLERMGKAAARMQSLIDALLDYSRITSQTHEAMHSDLSDVVREVLIGLDHEIEHSGARVEVKDLPLVAVNERQLRYLIENLISNAIKYRSGSPVINISSRSLGDEGNGDEFREILVEDNGIGFDEKYLGRIFAPFQRLHGKDAYSGTGMGLAICRKIAESCGGAITATSKPGVGSTFVVKLPLAGKQESPDSTRP